MKKNTHDKYSSFEALAQENILGVDYKIQSPETACPPDWLVAAIHGGKIEPGTSEIARAIADSGSFSYYAFEGIKTSKNKDLHITSDNFYEPRFDMLALQHDRVLGVHGCNDERDTETEIWVGGRASSLLNEVISILNNAGFQAKKDTHTPGRAQSNVCNRAKDHGIQLEITKLFRTQCFHDPKTRQHPTELLHKLTDVIVEILKSTPKNSLQHTNPARITSN